MKRLLLPVLLLMLSILCACEAFLEEEEVSLLPVNMSATLVQGTETKKIIADFNYIPGTELLDHITWSNHQTHYFEYDASNRIQVVRQLKVEAKVQEEMWFVYEGALVDHIDLVTRNLDYTFLEPVDSTLTGYIEFAYEGANVVVEAHYEFTQGGMREEFVWKVNYEYDYHGNMVSSEAFDPRTQSIESVKMTYDTGKHPFANLNYYFNGESFVNNLLSKTMVEENFDYTYDTDLNEHGYPETIYEKLGATHTRIIRYSYMTN